MADMEKNEIITNEAIKDITEANSNNRGVLKTIGFIGLGVAASALLTRFVLYPVYTEVVNFVNGKKRVSMRVKKPKEDEVELDDNDLDIPDID